MMVARIYGLLWILAAIVGGALYLTDSFSLASSMILVFFVSVLGGAALLVVYPAMLSERVSSGQY
jgi:hypothetical protein